MSKVRNAPGYEVRLSRRHRLVRWPTRGNVPASLVGFHHPVAEVPADPPAPTPNGVVQGAFTAVFKLRGEGRSPAGPHKPGPAGSTPAPATK